MDLENNMKAKIKEYVQGPGCPVTDTDIQDVGKFLENLADDMGILSVDTVVASAPGTILEKYFEWDDEQAAVNWRKKQARRLLQTVLAVVDYGNGEVVNRVFFSIPVTINHQDGQTRERRYINISLLTKEEIREAVVDEALARFRSLRKKYSGIKDLAKIFEAIDQFD